MIALVVNITGGLTEDLGNNSARFLRVTWIQKLLECNTIHNIYYLDIDAIFRMPSCKWFELEETKNRRNNSTAAEGFGNHSKMNSSNKISLLLSSDWGATSHRFQSGVMVIVNNIRSKMIFAELWAKRAESKPLSGIVENSVASRGKFSTFGAVAHFVCKTLAFCRGFESYKPSLPVGYESDQVALNNILQRPDMSMLVHNTSRILFNAFPKMPQPLWDQLGLPQAINQACITSAHRSCD